MTKKKYRIGVFLLSILFFSIFMGAYFAYNVQFRGMTITNVGKIQGDYPQYMVNVNDEFIDYMLEFENMLSEPQRVYSEEELKDITYPLINLFFAFSVQHQLGGMFNLKHIKSFITTSKSLDEKIREEIDMIRETFVKNGKQSEFDKLFEERKMKFPYSEDTLLTIVSGKDYLIPYFSERIKKIVGSFQVPREWWKYKMVEKVDVNRLNALKTALVSL